MSNITLLSSITFRDAGHALKIIRDRKLYRGCKTVEDTADLIGLECIVAMSGHPRGDSQARQAMMNPTAMREAERILSGPEWERPEPAPPSKVREREKPISGLYFIEATGTPFVKIGLSIGHKQRLSCLQIGCPYSLKLLAQIPGGFREEQELHTRFSHLRERGEWFKITAEITDFIQQTQKESQI